MGRKYGYLLLIGWALSGCAQLDWWFEGQETRSGAEALSDMERLQVESMINERERERRGGARYYDK